MLLTMIGLDQGLPHIHVLVDGILLTIVFELITVWFRFGRGLSASRTTASVGRITRGVRIHHGYVGVVIAGGAGAASVFAPPFAEPLLSLAIGLILSDLVHHFLVLWPITGSHEFHLRYPMDEAALAEVEAEQF